MPFIGNQPAESYSAFQKQDFTTSATTSYTLDHPVANQNEIALFINFVRQEPTTAYTASGTSLTLTSATSATDDMYCIYLGKAVQTVNPPSGSVGNSQVASTIITGQTAETSIATDDTVLIHDTSAGALRKMTRANFVSGVGGDNTPAFYGELASAVTLSRGVDTAITGFTTDEIDTDSAFNGTTFTVPSGEGGKYALTVTMTIDFSNIGQDGEVFEVYLKVNGSTVKSARTSTNSGNYRNINLETCTVETIQTLAAGDAVTFAAYGVDADGGGGGDVQAGRSSVQGYKLIGV